MANISKIAALTTTSVSKVATLSKSLIKSVVGVLWATPVYKVDYSCRFNDDDSARMTRTPGTAGNRKTWTFSTWLKRGNITISPGESVNFFGAGTVWTNATGTVFGGFCLSSGDPGDFLVFGCQW